jgi:hypothetical protein
MDLVEDLLGAKMRNSETLRVIWNGDSQTDCVEVCIELRRAGIVYKVAQQLVSRSIRMRANWRFQVGVLDSDYESARAALGLSAAGDEEIENRAMEIPESTRPISEFSRPEDETRSASSYLKSWHPENATVEVWWQVASNTPSIVELAFRENLIHYHLQHTENGRCKLFVLPEDEPRAREILREIEKGEPPTSQTGSVG